MKRSLINAAIADAMLAFAQNNWHLPPEPKWDVTGFGLGDFQQYGLTVVNLAELPEYCEKLMFCKKNQTTPTHTHKSKQEDIICRVGVLAMELKACDANGECSDTGTTKVLRNGAEVEYESGTILYLQQGERVTLYPGGYHAFWALGDYCIVGEVSTCNDDVGDNYFVNPDVGRFDPVEEDAPVLYKLVSE